MWLWSDIRSYLHVYMYAQLSSLKPVILSASVPIRIVLLHYGRNHVADNQTCVLCVVHCAVCACLKHNCLRVGLGIRWNFCLKIVRNKKKIVKLVEAHSFDSGGVECSQKIWDDLGENCGVVPEQTDRDRRYMCYQKSKLIISCHDLNTDLSNSNIWECKVEFNITTDIWKNILAKNALISALEKTRLHCLIPYITHVYGAYGQPKNITLKKGLIIYTLSHFKWSMWSIHGPLTVYVCTVLNVVHTLCMDHILHLVCIWGCYFLAPHTHVLCMGSGSATGIFPAPRLVHSLLKYFFKFHLCYWIQLYTTKHSSLILLFR